MPLIPFSLLPDDARVWVFGSSGPIDATAEAQLLAEVDGWLAEWKAHGAPLTCGRDWREGRFLVVGVDERGVGASGCSIDALYHVLHALQRTLGTTFLAGGRVFYRAAGGDVVATDRATFATLPLGDDTPVFDTAAVTAGAYRAGFERPLASAWHRELRPRDR